MKTEFEQLIEVTERLLGPQGCPWDQKQTMKSVRPHVLEEVAELIEAISLDENEKIKEELGDLFFNAVFFCKLAEKEGRFNTQAVIQSIIDKLIRRHPHVFGEKKLEHEDEVMVQWEQIKKNEKGNEDRKSLLDGIPKGLPALARAQKTLKQVKKTTFPLSYPPSTEFADEEELGNIFLQLVDAAQRRGIDAELALLQAVYKQDETFRQWEEEHANS